MTATLTRRSSAVAKAARIADVASHADDAGATVVNIACGLTHYDHSKPGRPRVADAVEIQTDGPGFLALVDYFNLRVVNEPGDGRNIYGYAEVGLLDLPVLVFAGLVPVLAAGLVTA